MATRYERVVLDLEDRFSTPMAKAAASAALMNRSLNDLDGQSVKTSRSMAPLGDPNGPMGKAGRQTAFASKEFDRASGRMRIMAETAAILGPGLIPIGAVGIPAVTGLASAFGFAAIGAGTLIGSMQGVGDALKAVNTAALEPSAANLEAAREAMHKIGPEAREFVARFQELRPALADIRDAGAAGWFPGLTEAMDDIERLGPKVADIFEEIGKAGGELVADGAASLASERWAEFFDFIETEAPAALSSLGHAVGNLAHGLAELWMGFAPLNQDVTGWLLNASLAFDDWATGLSKTQGFIEFVDYVRENGPRVGDALASVGGAIVQIVQAAAPLGGPVLEAISAFAKVVAAIADSDLGAPLFAGIAAMSALSRATATWGAISQTAAGKFVTGQIVAQNAIGQTYAKMSGLGKAGAVMAGLTLASSDMGDSFELSNTASMALIGTMGGPWGTAFGAATGFVMDFMGANDAMEASIRRVEAAFDGGTIQEQREALRGLKRDTDQASKGFLDLRDPLGLLANPVDAAMSSIALLSGTTGRARQEYDHFKASLNTGDIGALMGRPLGVAADAFLDADEALRKFETSFRRLNNLLTRSDTLIAYEQALDDLTKSIKENGDTWDRSTNKGRANLEARNALVQTAIDRSQKLREEGDKLGAQRILRRAMSDLEDFGAKSPKAKAAMADLIDELERLDRKHAEPKIDADNKPAKRKIDEADSWLLDYDKKRAVSEVDADASNAWAEFFKIDAWQPKPKTVHVGVSGSASAGIGGFAAGGHVPTLCPTRLPSHLKEN